jgi:hypothetical protein
VLVLVATAAKKEAMAPRRASVTRMHSFARARAPRVHGTS